MKGVFVTGIDTGIGKTVVSSILVNALKADYWKPVQSGDLDNTDTQFVQKNIANEVLVIHPEKHRLSVPASPHYSAQVDGVHIQVSDFVLPETDNLLVVEGAGGILVPLNEKELIADLIVHFNLPVVVVSKYYLGSINHTLLTVEALKNRGVKQIALVFNGHEVVSTRDIILKQTGLPVIGHIQEEGTIDRDIILRYAKQFEPALKNFLQL